MPHNWRFFQSHIAPRTRSHSLSVPSGSPLIKCRFRPDLGVFSLRKSLGGDYISAFLVKACKDAASRYSLMPKRPGTKVHETAEPNIAVQPSHQ
jgi:hypothetical protein